jgi:hypothetical protein
MKIQGQTIQHIDVYQIVESILGDSHHQKRLRSIANAALGVISSASLIVHRIGRGMAKELNLIDKHAVKQVDRLVSNKKLNVPECQGHWVSFVIGGHIEVKIAMDWTGFDRDGQTTLSLNLVTSHGRATPLLWKTFSKKELKNNRNAYEDELLARLREYIPEGVKVTILADRGFCDIKLFEFLIKDLGFHYIIRIRGNILVESSDGEVKQAVEWVSANGRTKTLRKAKITHEGYEVPTVVCVQAKGMKAPWCIVSSEEKISGSWVVKWYGKRWGCEPQFRDTKDIYYGMGLSKTHIADREKRDRILFIHAIATAILTFLGAAGENIGLDRYLKVNTVKKRTLSLLNQGIIYFGRIEKMAKETLEKLLTEFFRLIENNKNITEILGVI